MSFLVSRCCLVVFACLLASTHSHDSTGFTIEVPDEEDVCFYEDFEGSSHYLFEYKVLKGGNYDIDVTVSSPTEKEIFKKVRSSEDEFKFQISWGTYKFCFSNQFSTITHKLVYFELRPEEHSRLAVEGGKKGPTANTQAEESLEVIHSSATDIMAYQTKYRLEEVKDRNNAEELNKKVMFFSVVQAVVILVVGLGELFILKMFFTEKRVLLKAPNLIASTPVKP